MATSPESSSAETPRKAPTGGSGAGYLSVLRNRDFALIWFGKAVSGFGDSLRNIALIWLVKELTGSALAMGTVMLCSMVPYLVLALFAGAVVDMLDRKKVMIWADVLRGAITVVIPLLLLTGHLEFWHLCLGALVLASISTLFNPAMTASIPNVVGKDQLLAANSLNSLTLQVAGIAGPALGGIIVGLAGSGPALIIDSVSFMVSGLAIWLARIPGGAGARGAAKIDVKGVMNGVREGFGFIVSRKLLLAIMFVAVALNFIGAPTMILVAIHVDKVWGAGAEGYGMISSAFSVGYVLGTLIVAAVVARIRRDNLISGAIVVEGIVMFGLVFGTALAHGVAVFVLIGVANALVNIPLLTWAQQIVPDRIRGRVFSALEVGCMAAAPVALALAGSAADAFGTTAIFAFLAGATALGGLVLKWVFVAHGGDDPFDVPDEPEDKRPEPEAAGRAGTEAEAAPAPSPGSGG